MKTAAFFRVERVLFQQGFIQASAYLAGNRPGFRERFLRLGQVALSAPASKVFGVRVLALSLRGMTEDRIAVVGEEYFDSVLSGHLLKEGVALLDQARKLGHQIVLVSEEIEEVIGPLKSKLKGIAHLICNHLEYENGEATGKLIEPILGGFETGRWLKEFAAQNDIDLKNSVAYAGHAPDLLLLSGVGSPCAVNPDFVLRRAARDAKWPILEFTA